MAKILIIDDDPDFSEALAAIIERLGYAAVHATTCRSGLQEALDNPYDVVFLDVHLPDGSGLEILTQIQRTASAPEVIIITGAGEVEGAELAMQCGAWDYILKPISLQTIRLPLERALQFHEEKIKSQHPIVAMKFPGVIGSSPAMQACYDCLAQAAGSDAGVLITGETGTGKELLARAIHLNSSRFRKKLVTLDCAALPEPLVGSILFGHVKGAFTGAVEEQPGLIKQADGSTLFLDEVGELPLTLQKTFLRVLQEHRFRPLGSKQEISSNFRLIAATNQNLEQLVEAGQFRQDLLFRLRTLTIRVPPLRRRRSDIKELALHYVATLSERNKMGLKGMSPEFLEILLNYDWPGNVRELIHALEAALAKATSAPTLMPSHLPAHIRVELARASFLHKTTPPTGNEKGSATPSPLPTFREARRQTVESLEKRYLQELMAVTRGNISEACRVAGLSQSHLYNLLKKHRISLAHL